MLTARAPAKINLTLSVTGRRADGYHLLHSLVAFAGVGDGLSLLPGPGLSLTIAGPHGAGLAPDGDNLVLRAARNLMGLRPELAAGAFHLTKRLPVASGIGGGSADAAAALRLLARLNGRAPDDPALMEAARGTGADVPVCLAGRARIMAGIGDELGPPLRLPKLFAVLVNPRVAVATAQVFAELGMAKGDHSRERPTFTAPHPEEPFQGNGVSKDGLEHRSLLDGHPSRRRFAAPQDEDLSGRGRGGIGIAEWLASRHNDLEPPAIRLAPIIADVLASLRSQPGCTLARMSGSGATCFGLFADCTVAADAARTLKRLRPDWWITPTVLR
jgi:4-diphosphocytidyl-2-C-methyl-D-erythritol kinase